MSDRTGDAAFQGACSRLIDNFYVVVKVALVHRMDNEAVGPAVERFQEAMRAFERDVGGEASLQFVGDALYVNQRLVRAEAVQWERAEFLREFFGRMRLSEISFKAPLPERSTRDFVQAVRDVALDRSLLPAVHARKFEGIAFRHIEAAVGHEAGAIMVSDRVRALRGYGVLVLSLRDVLIKLRRKERPDLLPVRRALQELGSLPRRATPLLHALMRLDLYRQELAGRLGFIGLVVLVAARRAGLKGGALRDVAVAGALAQVGLATNRNLTRRDAHPLAIAKARRDGARALVPASGLGTAAALRVITALDLTDPMTRKAGHPVSRLVAVAEAFEELTRRDFDGTPGAAPDVALRAIVGDDAFDESMVRLLVRALGPYPVGTFLELEDGRIALVTDVGSELGGDGSRLALPLCAEVVVDDLGPFLAESIDLSTAGLRITGAIDPQNHGLNVGSLLFAEPAEG